MYGVIRKSFLIISQQQRYIIIPVASDNVCDTFSLTLLYIRLTMKNVIGREHSINSQ